ncbi:topoisomerase I binding, arginine/serine-rich a [Salminus brasiliensis]|uniref:topoisomerase I binding, arginine/serine-rich a n=1 Tax=Salminus brasiliensis TaxID=930266 RepID=UPI003B82E6FB
MASAKTKLTVLKKSSSTTAPKTISKEASPDSKCPICLDQFKNISYVDKCLHRFCFRCIHEWSKNKAECPLCKQPFSSIYHSIKAEDDFKQYDLRPSDNGSFGSLAGQRFRYRTTLTGDRRPERRTSPPPDHGVMFEGLSGSVSHGNDRGFRRMLARLAARQLAQGEGRTLRTLREQEMIQFRRTLYRQGLRVQDVRDGGRSRETSAEFFRGNPACLHRLVPWLKRELTVLYGTHGSLVNIVQHIVMSQITRYDMQNPAVLQELRPFLLSRTEHFLHEFLSFARSPFNMEAYDQSAVYDCPAPSVEGSGGSDSSVITVSEDEVNLPPAAALSQTPWDDETPGPSYSTEPPRVLTVSVNSSDSDSEEEAGPSAAPVVPATVVTGEEDHSGGEEDCMIVGYVKPTADRTPELVQLSSDSEDDEEEEETKNNHLIKTSQPQHIRFTSSPDSPGSSQSAAPHRPTAADRNGASHERSSDRHSASPRRSSKHHQCRNSRDEGRRHSKYKQKDGSRNRDVSSRGHKRRSRSKDRKRSKETSPFHQSHAPLPHTRHSYSSSRYHSHTHYSSFLVSSVKHARSPPRSRCRSHERSQARSRPRSRDSSQARSHSRSRSRRSRSRRSRSRRSRSRRSRSRRSRSRDRRWTQHPSPSSCHRKSRHDKPSGKRKYKSLHLEPSGAETTEDLAQSKKRRSRGKRVGKREGKRRSSPSPSLEIVYEGDSGEALQKKRHHKKKKHKKKSKRKRSKERRERKSPTVITINSESDDDGHVNDTAVNHPSANEAIEATSGSVTSEITASSQNNEVQLGLLMGSSANNSDANDASSSNMTPSIPVHSVSLTATDANGANDANDANGSNSTGMPSHSPERTSRPDPAEPPVTLPSHTL